MSEKNELERIEQGAPPAPTMPMTVEAIKAGYDLIKQVQREVMKENVHYGVIPGTDKDTLLKPGAEALLITFNLAADPDVEIVDLGNGHREYRVRARITNRLNGLFLGSGVGSASTMESKYRYRNAGRKCPRCGAEAIIKGKVEYGGGWLCWAKKGGCGAKFKDGDRAIEGQQPARVEYPDPADYYNTCLKMSKKRALVDAALTVTAASDLFTQDVEDMPGVGEAAPASAQSNQHDGNGHAQRMAGSEPAPPLGHPDNPFTPTPDDWRPPEQNGGNGKDKSLATDAQRKAIEAICKRKGFRAADHLWDGITQDEAAQKIQVLNSAEPSKKGGE